MTSAPSPKFRLSCTTDTDHVAKYNDLHSRKSRTDSH